MKRHRTVTQMGYADYIQSEEWAAKRAEYRRSRLFKGCCLACASTNRILHIHHRTYARLGNEYLRDLVALCDTCHAEVHRRHRLMPKRTSLPKVTDKYIRERWERDLTRPRGTGAWSKQYMRRWQAARNASKGDTDDAD